MMIKNLIKKSFNRFGYTISKSPEQVSNNIEAKKQVPVNTEEKAPENVFIDIQRMLLNKPKPIIFDVGANLGQTIAEFKKYLPNSIIHSFEPGPESFVYLSERYGNREDIILSQTAVGSANTKKELLENERSNMSSFFELGPSGWGAFKTKTVVDVQTIDSYCEQNNINFIDVLKSDAQGFELEIFKGALSMMPNIQLIYFEAIFSEMYKGLPRFGDIYNLLADHNFRIVKFYDFYYQDGLLSWTDVLLARHS